MTNFAEIEASVILSLFKNSVLNKSKRMNIPEVFDPENFEDDEPEDHYQMLGAAIIHHCDISLLTHFWLKCGTKYHLKQSRNV